MTPHGVRGFESHRFREVKTVSDEAAWKEMWNRKADGREMFAQAELTEDHEFRRWNGHDHKHKKLPEFSSYHKKAGEVVLITCVSRFGHACIRGTNVDSETHGYDGGIDPSKLKNLKFLSDGGKPWRMEMFKEMGIWDDAAHDEKEDDADRVPEL